MNWIYTSKEDAINLDNLAHVWMQECPNGFFLMGEMIHNQEEVVLGDTFLKKEQCMKALYEMFKEEKLPDDFKDILTLRDIDGLSYNEISDILGINLSNVKVRIHRGREYLKNRLHSRGLI